MWLANSLEILHAVHQLLRLRGEEVSDATVVFVCLSVCLSVFLSVYLCSQLVLTLFRSDCTATRQYTPMESDFQHLTAFLVVYRDLQVYPTHKYKT